MIQLQVLWEMICKLHIICFSSVIFTLVLLNCKVYTTFAYVSLAFEPEILHINDDINISCTVHGIVIIDSNLTRQWSKGPDTICYNGHSTDSSKYTEILTSANQFKLRIRNVSDSDFDCQYQCIYGFHTQQKKMLNNFEYPPANEEKAIVHTNESDRFLTIKLHFMKIFPLPRCTALVEGKNLSFNFTSSKSFGNYYELDLIHQSVDKLHCNGEVIVKCNLRKEYIIPTEDLRKCFSKENQSDELYVVILVIFIPLIMICILVFVICKLKKRKNEKAITREWDTYQSECFIQKSKQEKNQETPNRLNQNHPI